MPEGAMLQVRAVATFYGAIQALHGVDLDVAEGEIVALIGANGAGKSIRLISGKTSTGCSRCSRGLPSAASSAVAPCRAVNSRCWRSVAP